MTSDNAGPLRILIVDDDASTRKLLFSLLGDQGYEVIPCGNGREALEAVDRAAPDLVISDLLMPEMDGFTLCRRLKERREFRNLPFIFYSGTYTDGPTRALASALGADHLLIKPVPLAELVRIVHETLHGECRRGDGGIDGGLIDRLHLQAVTQKLNDKLFREGKEPVSPALPEGAGEEPAEAALPPAEAKRICEARDRLVEDLMEPPSLIELAHAFGINEKKLNRGFQQLFGMSVFGYLREARLGRACELLANSRLPVQMVAERVGYRHGGDFTVSFKQRYGITPREYRKQHQRTTL